MNAPKSIKFAINVLFSLLVMLVVMPTQPAQAALPLDLAIERQLERNSYIKLEKVVDALGITPGMTILDIGSGPGYASFMFAERLHGSGEVFVTDIRADFVGYVAEEAKRRGLANLSSAVVKNKGFDEFYGKHRYDLVLLSNVYHCLDEPVDYFTKLREFLKPGARVVLIIYKQAPLFGVDDLSDVDTIAKSLATDDLNDPFIKHLSAATKQLLSAKDNNDALKNALVEDFNRMLTDPRFYEEFYHDSYFTKNLFLGHERDFANWLLMALRENGVFTKPADQIDEEAMRSVIKLNRLFFMKRFGRSLANGGAGAYTPAGDANRHTSKYAMLKELAAAGYELSKEINLSVYFDAVIMVQKSLK